MASSSSAFTRARVERSRCSAAGSSGLRDESVPDPTYGFDPTRFFQAAAKLVGSLLEAVLEPLEGAPPHMLEKLSPCNHLALVRSQKLQHQQRPSLQLYRSRSEKRLSLRGVDLQSAADHNPIAR